jgi:hypothetical protein
LFGPLAKQIEVVGQLTALKNWPLLNDPTAHVAPPFEVVRRIAGSPTAAQ